MIWSLVKILFFIGIAAALAFGAGLLMETPGGVRLAFNGQEWTLTPLAFLISLILLMIVIWLILKLAGLCVAVVRFLLGDKTAINRYFDRRAERRGFDALGDSLMALASGDARKAQSSALKAEKLLNRPELTHLVSAQAAEANGNHARAAEIYKAMLSNEKSRFLAIKGLLKQQLDAGNTDTALRLAEKAFAINPKHDEIGDTLFTLQSRKSDWSGARTTLAAKVRQSALPKDVGKRREAVLLVADAIVAKEAGEVARARDAAYQANRVAPDFVPAAALAARLHIDAGEPRKASKILKRAWSTNPHPDLAAAFAEIAPAETPIERSNRFKPLLAMNADDAESKLVGAELALAAEDFPGARRALGPLAEEDPTTRSLAIMAAIEKGEGASDIVVRGWLAKALSVPRGECWICSNCHTVHADWSPVCDACESFDTMAWARPVETGQGENSTVAMLPLIIGALEDRTEEEDLTWTEPEPDTGPAVAEPEVKAEKPAPKPDWVEADAVMDTVNEDDEVSPSAAKAAS
ncbi:heme biosynthesis protein HemY [Algicella marina]|uniref:Heme biosynthesis protein HemY n=1 Tax=Algicella marina TaxID=2683284 RepID=A0A6P1T554_9RHOB|nr:heme biosynthesis HemY N-terminal domain-containing protein [Algicella marina]QHQ36901.1 heme biosynthesis protein HemY [Algicella marina]